jgi:hypothetical protein
VDLACGFDEVLKMSTCKEVTQVDKFAVPLILDVDGTPAVLAGRNVAAGLALADVVLQEKSWHHSPVNVDGVLRADDSEGNDGLDLSVHSSLLRVILLVLVRVHPDVVEGELLLDAVLELLALLKRERVGLCDDWNNVDSLAQLLEDNNVDWLETVAGRWNEVEAAVDASVLDVARVMLVTVVLLLEPDNTYRSRWAVSSFLR